MPLNQLYSKFIQPLIAATSTQGTYYATAQIYDSFLAIIKPISVLITVGLIAATVYFVVATNWYIVRRNRIRDVVLKANYPKRRVIKIWRDIEGHVSRGDEKDLRLAVIEADKVLDEVLKKSGFKGMDLGERLRGMNDAQLSNLNAVWEAHKLRNRIVHEIDFTISKSLAERALAVYEQAFKELGLLD